MLSTRDYIHEIKKFTTSVYWATGVRITAGVMLPTLIMAHYNWLASGMPFLWGALFVSITDSPGPIHHRRNGLLAAVAFNTVTVFITIIVREHQALLLSCLIFFGFFYSLLNVFGNRAGAIGVLALVMMLLNLVPRQYANDLWPTTLLIFAGGMWYTSFSLLLHSIRPYRLAEQAVGENIIAIASYMRARASLYREESDIKAGFNRVMDEQTAVLKSQDQAREILFKTRQFIGDASPKSRSIMMIFIESVDLLEQTMSAYQDYEWLHKNLKNTNLLNRFYGVILRAAAELEHVGLIIQGGAAIRKDITFASSLSEVVDALHAARNNTKNQQTLTGIDALDKGLKNLTHIAAIMQRLVQYTRLELDTKSYSSIVEVNNMVIGQPIRWQEIRENLTLKSNTFRHALRLTLAMLIGYALSFYFTLSHAYWVLLTIVTILKPVYTTSRKRNVQRVGGTLTGALIAIIILNAIHSTPVLLGILIVSMILGYSLLRVNYFGFVIFLTLYIIISFHFLNPDEFRLLITDRLIDTVIGSVIAFLAARFILPVWTSEEIENSMLAMIDAADAYFAIAWQSLPIQSAQSKEYLLARKDAVVALTNLSENFQRILSEPKQTLQSVQLHQFVIASHLLVGHIAALGDEKIIGDTVTSNDIESAVKKIRNNFQVIKKKLNHYPEENTSKDDGIVVSELKIPAHLDMIYDLVHDLKMITGRMQVQ